MEPAELEAKLRVLSYMGLERMAKSLEAQIQKAKGNGQDTTVLDTRLKEIKAAMQKT